MQNHNYEKLKLFQITLPPPMEPHTPQWQCAVHSEVHDRAAVFAQLCQSWPCLNFFYLMKVKKRSSMQINKRQCTQMLKCIFLIFSTATLPTVIHKGKEPRLSPCSEMQLHQRRQYQRSRRGAQWINWKLCIICCTSMTAWIYCLSPRERKPDLEPQIKRDKSELLFLCSHSL